MATPVNQATNEAKLLSRVGAILQNVFSGNFPIGRQEFGHAGRPRKQICSVTELGCLDNYRSLKLENVLLAKQVDKTGALAEFPIEEAIVIWFPGNQGDIKIVFHAQAGADLAEFADLNRLGLKTLAETLENCGITAHLTVNLSRFVNLTCQVRR